MMLRLMPEMIPAVPFPKVQIPRLALVALAVLFGPLAFAQDGAPATVDPKVEAANRKAAQQASQQRLRDERERDRDIANAEANGIEVRLKEIARFRGIRPNQIMGVGLVVGLSGTGDSRKTAVTASIASNLFKDFGINIEASQIDMRNVAAVMVTAELPPFATNGLPIDVNVQSLGDAKSLAGGTLLQTPLFAAGDRETVYAMAMGSIALGGFDVSGGGSSQKKNFVTAGRVPGGAMVQRGAPTRVVYDGGKMFLDLDMADLTTAHRVVGQIQRSLPQLNPVALNGGTIELTLPTGLSEVTTMAQLEQLKVMVDAQGTIVVNERTGTIAMGGNVRVGPAVIAHGSLNVRIDEEVIISQPAPLSNGTTVQTSQFSVGAEETNAQIAVVRPTTTVADLARLFQALDLKAADIISILQALRQQGALKARIITQ